MAGPGVGDRAPDFELPWTGEGTFRLADHRGEWVVLAFYPGDFTPTCTRQLCSYGELTADGSDLDARLVGISPQGVDTHVRFAGRHGLTMPLVADEDMEVAATYGAKRAGFVRRAVFVVDPDGVVRFRDVKLLGLSYLGPDELRDALDDARRATAA